MSLTGRLTSAAPASVGATATRLGALLTTTVQLSARGPQSAATAWERYADPALWATWSPQIRKVEASTDRIALGTTGRVWSYAPVPVHFVVDAVDEALRTWSWTVAVGPVRIHLEHGVRGGAFGTTTTLAMTGPAPVVLAYAPLARLALQRLVR